MSIFFILLSLWVLSRIVTELVEIGQEKSVCACVGESFSNNLITMLLNPCQNRSGQQVAQSSPFGTFSDGCLSVSSSAWRRLCHGGLVMCLLNHLDFVSEKRKTSFLQS